jgi:Tfp pilus assembly protein PilO
MSDSANPDHWHLDKKVPVGIIITLFIQFLGGVWFMSKLESRVMALESIQAEQRQRDDRQDRATTEAVSIIRAQLDRIDSNILQLIRDGSRK